MPANGRIIIGYHFVTIVVAIILNEEDINVFDLVDYHGATGLNSQSLREILTF